MFVQHKFVSAVKTSLESKSLITYNTVMDSSNLPIFKSIFLFQSGPFPQLRSGYEVFLGISADSTEHDRDHLSSVRTQGIKVKK